MNEFGDRVRELRLKRRLTLQDLGKKAELSGSFLSQLERGSSSVSIVALSSICAGLGVSLSEFFAGVENVIPAEIRSKKSPTAMGNDVIINVTDGAIKYKFISKDAPGKLEVAVGHFTRDDQLPLTSHEGEEHGYILQGVLRLTIGNDVYVLHPGNSYSFPSATPHKYEAADDEPVTVVWVKSL